MSELDDQIQRSLEGLLTPEAEAALQTRIVAEPAVRTQYVEHLWLHSTLRAQRELLVELPPAPVVIRRWPVIAWAAGLAAAVTLVASVLTLGRGTVWARPVATLVQAENCRWAGSELPTAPNSRLGTGRLALVEGLATLRFKNGATLTIEAPTTLEILSAMHCRLVEGTVTAEVPEPAHGFTIDTPDIKVKDLGTRFGLTTGSAGNSQVRVFQGEVEIGGLKDGQPKRLTEGKGLHVGSGPTATGQEATRGQPVQEAGGWTAIPTSFGRGQDATVRRGDTGAPLGAQPLLLVKHSDLPASLNNERRAILTFDVSAVKTTSVQEAQLVLDPEPSGFGFSALVPGESHFAVYGLTEEALDAWPEKEVRWATLPGALETGPNPAQTRRVAEFWLPRGGSAGPLTIRGEELARLVREDTNGLITLLVVRETGEMDPNGLAHGFASREHPTARPPTLRLK